MNEVCRDTASTGPRESVRVCQSRDSGELIIWYMQKGVWQCEPMIASRSHAAKMQINNTEHVTCGTRVIPRLLYPVHSSVFQNTPSRRAAVR